VNPTRRAVLAISAAVPALLAGCRGVQVLGTPPPPPADVRLLRGAITAEEQLVSSYAAAIPASAPAAAAVLAAVLAEHRQHLAQLRSRLIEPHPRVTSQQPIKASALALAERAASDRLIAHLGALPPSLAQLFASIGASEATHVPLLRSLQTP
jgi:hypothetical protein